jgi:hypothetical protein
MHHAAARGWARAHGWWGIYACSAAWARAGFWGDGGGDDDDDRDDVAGGRHAG